MPNTLSKPPRRTADAARARPRGDGRLPASLGLALSLVAACIASSGVSAVELDGRTVVTPRRRIEVGPSGLPQQIVVQPQEHELPLELRGGAGEVPANMLSAIGRGPQLRGPVRLEGTIDGKEVVAEFAKTAAPKLVEGRVTAMAEGRLGPLTVNVESVYGEGGALQATLTYAGNGKIDELALVMEIAGPVDVVVPRAGALTRLEGLAEETFALGADEGVVWANGTAPGSAPGVVRHLYVGSGDRGWTWLCDDESGWLIDPKQPTMTLSRDAAGTLTWRVLLVNRPGAVKGKHTLSFALVTHPARPKPSSHRSEAWLAWPHPDVAAATPAVSGKALASGGTSAVLRADCATPLEASVAYALLSGPAGGDAISAEQDHINVYPLAFMRYLAGTHTGQVRRLLPNAAELVSPGGERRLDRSLIARALLHDIGLDAAGLAHLADAATVVRALQEFGLFKGDGQTEFVPYWRSRDILRYGEEFDADDAFATAETDPAGRVYVSVFRRPAGQGGKRAQALILIVNEGDQPVRDQLYILSPAHLFGGPNRLTDRDVVSGYDFSNLPDNSDWGKPGMQSTRYKSAAVLRDAEDQGTVRMVAAEDGIEAYGPHIFVRSHDFRLFYGTGGRP